ncbi:MipA/OmpV family protein [Hyphomicrobium sp.]|uniref:MipA/OmpV family protein n=1 Tax=Hyphomicrobium sp. TaxID=82 RepID=UPI003F70DE4C
MLSVRSKAVASALVVFAATPVSFASAGGFGDLGLGNTDWQVGGFVFVAPKYEGAKEYEVRGAPFIAPTGLDNGTSRVQFRGPDDLRFRVLEFSGFEAGPLVGWRFDRDDNDAARLRGLGDVDGGVVAGGYVAYRGGPVTPFVSYHHQVSGDDTGGLIRFGAEARAPLASGIFVLATLGASYADDEYMDAYFSVTPGQSAASVAGLAVYDAEAGIKDVYFGLTTDVPLSDVWTLKLSGRYSRLVGDASDSPIVEDENQFFGGLGLSYRFNID